MHRKALQQLKDWKNSANRKPLIIRGARQVGKTWLAREFGSTAYDSMAYINLDGNTQAKSLFELDYDVERVIDGLELMSGVKIEPGKTLIVLDEIQEVPRALSALKYFYENKPEYHVVALGSLLGVAIHQGTSFPVGKVDFIDLHPLNFVEFLQAIDNEGYADIVTDRPDANTLTVPFHEKLIDLLRIYYVVGGMPEAILSYIEEGNLLKVRQIQANILTAYDQDFSKHAPVNVVPRIREIWDTLPAQLAKENKRFFFRMIREGARAKEYEAAMLWLEDAGLVGRVSRVNKPALPLMAYADTTIFKLFLLDVGLLGAKSGLDPKVILNHNTVFVEFKGSLTEQFVYQELRTAGIEVFYYANDSSRGEIDFMVAVGEHVVPIEVKSGKNISIRSLKEFIAKHPDVQPFVASTLPLELRDTIGMIPLYMVGRLEDLVALYAVQ